MREEIAGAGCVARSAGDLHSRAAVPGLASSPAGQSRGVAGEVPP